MNFRRAFTSLLSFALLLCSGVALQAQAYTTIVVFGDSLSDTGNFARLSSNAYGSGFRIPGTAGNYTDGRFTDGPVTLPPAQMYTGIWIEQMAGTLAAHPVVGDSLDGGTDYAYGSATTGSGTQVVTYGPNNGFTVTVQNIGAQIAAYLATNPVITNRTLFVVWGGANDILQATTPAQIAAAAGQDVANVQALITAGATDFIIPNLPPLGAIPRLNGNATVAAQATAATAAYNSTVAAQVGNLPASNPGKTLHLYQMDIFSLFNSVLASPSVFGIANDTQMSQYQLVNPDTYLFWDDLHPTTYGHYLISRLAKNLLTENTPDTTTLTVGTVNALPGQTVSLKAVVAPNPIGTTPMPTGLVTFYSGSTALATATLDSTGTATASLVAGPISGSPYAITAHYSGDGVYYANVSAAQALSVIATPVQTSFTGLSSSSASVNFGSSVTFTATVASAVGPPTGTVTFMDGMTVLGMAPLVVGTTTSTATYTALSLAVGTHSITASLAANATYAGTSSGGGPSVVVAAPSYTFTASPTSITVPSGLSGTTTLTLTPAGGLAGNYTLACGTLPAHFSCAFSPATVTLTGTGGAQSSTLTIGTNTAAGLRMPVRPGEPVSLPLWAALGMFPGLGGLALLGRRRLRGVRLSGVLWTGLLVALSAGAALGVSGCAKSNNAPSGTYQVPVMATPSGSGSAATLTLTVVVQ